MLSNILVKTQLVLSKLSGDADTTGPGACFELLLCWSVGVAVTVIKVCPLPSTSREAEVQGPAHISCEKPDNHF